MKLVSPGLFFSLLLLTPVSLFSQGVFHSQKSGRWNNADTWVLVSGTDSNGKPDGNDEVHILNGHNIELRTNKSCRSLTMDGGRMNFQQPRTLKVNNNLVATADSEIAGFANDHILEVNGDLIVDSGQALTIGALQVKISGESNINGDLTLSGFGQTKSFGDITIHAGARLACTGADTYDLNGDLTNNGTFEATDFGQVFNFLSAAGSISGNQVMSFHEVTFNSPAAYTNTGNVQIRNQMTGTGSFTNGTGAQLELQNEGPFSVASFDASATGNTVTYTGFNNPTALAGDYYDLVLNKSSGTLTFNNSMSVLADLSIQNGILDVTATLSVGDDLLISGGELAIKNGALINIADNLSMTGGQYDHDDGRLSVSDNFVATGGEVFVDGSSSQIEATNAGFTVPMTLNGGSFSVSGDFILDTGTVLLGRGTEVTAGSDFLHYNGSAEFSSGGLTAANIYIAPGVELIVTNATVDAGNFALIDGTFTINGSNGLKSFRHIFVRSGGTWNLTQPGTINVAGNMRNNGIFNGDPGYGSAFYNLSSSTGQINGFNPFFIRNIRIDDPGNYRNFARLKVSARLTGSGSFTNGTNGELTYAGNNSNGSNFDIASFDASAINNTVIFASSNSSQQWRPTVTANNDYYHVILNTGTGGYQRLKLVEDVKVNGNLTITEGDVLLNQYNLALAVDALILGADHDDYIRVNGSGKVRQFYNETGGTVFIPIGDNSGNYSPINDFTLKGGTLGSNPYVDFSVVRARHPERDTGNEDLGGNDTGQEAEDYLERYWTLVGNDIENPLFDVSYSYVDDDIEGTESNMIAALYRTLPGFNFKDWDKRGVVMPNKNMAIVNDGDSFGDLYAMDDNKNRLPIQLISFNARSTSSGVELTWVTASEEGNDFFTIERSADGLGFEDIKKVSGAGDSNEVLTYTATDQNPLNGRSYYRLKQTDYNGTYDYSELVSVAYERSSSPISLNIYPNPVSRGKKLRIEIGALSSDTQSFWLRLLNTKGLEVVSQAMEMDDYEENGIFIPDNIKDGMYILTVTSEDDKFQKKVLID